MCGDIRTLVQRGRVFFRVFLFGVRKERQMSRIFGMNSIIDVDVIILET